MDLDHLGPCSWLALSITGHRVGAGIVIRQSVPKSAVARSPERGHAILGLSALSVLVLVVVHGRSTSTDSSHQVVPLRMPETRKRWQNRKTASTGVMATSVASASWGFGTARMPRPTCTGYWLLSGSRM